MKRFIISVVPSGKFLLFVLIQYISNYTTVNEIGLTSVDFFLFATFSAQNFPFIKLKWQILHTFKLCVLNHSITLGMHSKGILIAFLIYFQVEYFFERDDFILDQCVASRYISIRKNLLFTIFVFTFCPSVPYTVIKKNVANSNLQSTF